MKGIKGWLIMVAITALVVLGLGIMAEHILNGTDVVERLCMGGGWLISVICFTVG